MKSADLAERLKKLEKENYILRSELDNKFNKERILIEEKLSDAEREKLRLF